MFRHLLCLPLLFNSLFSAEYEPLQLDPIELTATRVGSPIAQQPYAIIRHDRGAIDAGVGRTSLDRINYESGVFIQRTAPAQASPFVRGLTGEQTLLLLDGVRLSHAGMRKGPNQYSAMVPEGAIEGIDGLLGSSSVVNGSDGHTGAVDFRLRPAGRDVEEPASPWLRSLVDQANGSQVTLGIDGSIPESDFRYSAEFDHRDYHDRVGGSDAERNINGGNQGDQEIPNTSYEQWSASTRLHWDLRNSRFDINAGHTVQTDAPRPDGYAENSFNNNRISRYYDPQTFTYLHLRHEANLEQAWAHHLKTTLYWHQHDEEQIRERISGGRYRRQDHFDTIDGYGLDLEATSFIAETMTLTWGATLQHEVTSNDYKEWRSPAGVVDPDQAVEHNPGDWANNTTISDGAEYDTLGLFLQSEHSISHSLSLLYGLRYSHHEWSFGEVEGDTSDLTWSLRAQHSFDENSSLFAGVSKGFRAPNLTNLDGAVDRGSSGNLAVGNPDLKAETSINTEIGYRRKGSVINVQATLFDTRIDDYIQEDVTKGSMTNLDGAHLYGAELSFEAKLLADRPSHPTWLVSLENSTSYVRAKADISEVGGTVEDNISRANRLYGKTGLRFEGDMGLSALLQARWHDAYDDVATSPTDSDANDVRLTVPGYSDGSMPGYAVVDLRIDWPLGKDRAMALGMENLLNKTYREPGSGTDGAGRNLFAQLSWRL